MALGLNHPHYHRALQLPHYELYEHAVCYKSATSDTR